MRSKILVRNRGYALALRRIGRILQDVEAEKDRQEEHKKRSTEPPKRKTTKELEEELEDDLRELRNPNNPDEEKTDET